MVQLTYYEPTGVGRDRSSTVAPACRHGDLRYDYTLEHLHHITRWAVRASLAKAMDYDDRFAAAWGGVVEHLYACTEPPSSLELIQAGERALARMILDEYRHYGYAGRDGYAGAGSGTNYQRFWWTTPTPSPENRVVDRTALSQIWPRLSDGQREALAALAATEDYHAAAEALGITPGTFTQRISKARAAFLRLWHEGEEPSRVWGTDRRVGSRSAAQPAARKRRAATRAVVRRTGRPRHELVHGKASTYANHGCRCVPCTDAATVKAAEKRLANGTVPRRHVTVSQLAGIRARNERGESLRAIAADLGFSDSYLSRLLSGVRKPAPDPIREAA